MFKTTFQNILQERSHSCFSLSLYDVNPCNETLTWHVRISLETFGSTVSFVRKKIGFKQSLDAQVTTKWKNWFPIRVIIFPEYKITDSSFTPHIALYCSIACVVLLMLHSECQWVRAWLAQQDKENIVSSLAVVRAGFTLAAVIRSWWSFQLLTGCLHPGLTISRWAQMANGFV